MRSALSPRGTCRRRAAAVGRPASGAAWLLAALLAVGASARRRRSSTAPAEGFGDLVGQIAPAVVNISTRKDVAAAGAARGAADARSSRRARRSRSSSRTSSTATGTQQEQQPRRSFSLGSGFVIDPTGFVVTNNHVIADADEITVIFNDESRVSGQADRHRQQDRSGAAQDRAAGAVPVRELGRQRPGPGRRLDDRDRQPVRAGLDRHRRDRLGARPRHPGRALRRLLPGRRRDQPRQFGWPELHDRRQVFGVNTAIFSPSGGNVGIGFAIPSNLAKPVIDSLMQSGKVARGWLGVRIQSVTDEIAESLGLPETDGALVASVTPGGPAAKAADPGRRRDPRSSTARPSTRCARCRGSSPRPRSARRLDGQAVAQGSGDDARRGPGRAARGRAAGRARPGRRRRRRRRPAPRSTRWASPSPAWRPSSARSSACPRRQGRGDHRGQRRARRRPRRASSPAT